MSRRMQLEGPTRAELCTPTRAVAPPGLPGRLPRLGAFLPGGIFLGPVVAVAPDLAPAVHRQSPVEGGSAKRSPHTLDRAATQRVKSAARSGLGIRAVVNRD